MLQKKERQYKMMRFVYSLFIITTLSSIWNPVLSRDNHWVRLIFKKQTKLSSKLQGGVPITGTPTCAVPNNASFFIEM